MKSKYGFGPGLICLSILAMLCCIVTCLAQQPVNVAITGSKPLYEEGFSTSKNSLFGSFSDKNSSNNFENGKYRFRIFQMNRWSGYQTIKVPRDFILEVEATQVSGPNDNGYGVWIGYLKNYYYFQISGDGYYQIGNNALSEILKNVWTKSDAIHTGNATNLIKIICNDDKFAFYVNDIYVDELTDANSYEKRIGLMASKWGSPGTVTIDFDNLRVWEDIQQ